MKDNGPGYPVVKGSLLIKVLVKALKAVEAGQKLPIFQMPVNYFLFS